MTAPLNPSYRIVLSWFLGLIMWALAVVGTPHLHAQLLIPANSQWRYLADGSDQGTEWTQPSFDDVRWRIGAAKLGFGDDGEITVIGDTNTGYITYYSRRTFIVNDASAITSLRARTIVDDGAVVYLNGLEAFRVRMPAGPVLFDTLATLVNRPEETNFVTNAICPGLLLNGPNVLAVEVHQSNPSSTDLGFAMELRAYMASPPPTLALARFPNDPVVPAGTNLTLTASVNDPDGTVARVAFYVDNQPLFFDGSAPFAVTWGDVVAGGHTLRADGLNACGQSIVSTAVTVNVSNPSGVALLVPNGALWKYLDTGSNQDVAWRAPSFDDSAWDAGPGELGFGDTDDDPPRPERTMVNGGPATNRFITTYFRHDFLVDDPFVFTNLVLRLLRDDGGVVYLNGVEVFRSNMNPTNDIFYDTPALATATDDGTTFVSTDISPAQLEPGTNVLAVEIHQNSPTSSDLTFDLMLLGQGDLRPVVTGLQDQVVAVGGMARFSITVAGPGPFTYQWARNGTNLQDGARISGTQTPVLQIQGVVPQDAGDYTVTVMNPFGTATASARLCVAAQPPQFTLQPDSLTAPFCSDVQFTVAATECPSYQWFHNGVAIPGATNATLVLTNVQRPEVGIYVARALNPAGSANSAPAELQILLQKTGAATKALIALDQLLDFIPAPSPPPRGRAALAPAILAPGGVGAAPPLAHGVPLLFTTIDATKDAGEPNHCGLVGGHSKWVYHVATRNELLRVSTEGSDFDTVLAVYTGNGSGYSGLSLQACTNDSSGLLRSVVRFPAVVGIYYIAVDGKNGATGTVRLQIGDGRLHSPTLIPTDTFQFHMTGVGGRNYQLQSSAVMATNAANWQTILTTNVPEGLKDWVLLYSTSINTNSRYYRGLEE